jgi:HK97 family phage major capsid protein
MLDDADYDIESLMIQDGSMGFAEGEADAFINGNGVKKPRGIMSQTFAYTGDNSAHGALCRKLKLV